MSSKPIANNSLLIADTGPLLALARIGQLALLAKLYSNIVVTQAVFDECQAKPARLDALAVKAAYDIKLFVLVEDPKIPTSLSSLDLGEQTVLAAAKQRNATALIDESKGRKVAKARQIPVVGTVGILLLAKKHGLIAAIKPFLMSLLDSGYRLSPALLTKAMVLANE